jgi:outer membrane receptor protein involved in Fe transport
VGACSNRGNAGIQRSAILNADARFEFYRRPGEILSVSGFYKGFDAPIVEVVFVPGGGQCEVTYINGRTAYNYGVELEARREMLVPGLVASVNVTLVQSGVAIDSVYGAYDADLPLQGQSPYLLNGSVAYAAPSGRFNASLLANYFASRVVRYGTSNGASGQGPNLHERGRLSLDAKVQFRVGAHLTLSLGARNLTNAVEEFYHPADVGDVVAGFARRGVSLSTGLGYAF